MHEWERKHLVQEEQVTENVGLGPVKFDAIWAWQCRECGVLVAAPDEGGKPGLRGRHMTCEEVFLEAVHRS